MNNNPTSTPKKTVYYSSEKSTTIVDENGVVKEENQEKTVKSRLPKEPPFVKLYLDCLSKFKDVQFSFNPILLEFLKRASYADEITESCGGGQVLYLNKRLKQNIATKCNVSLNRVEHAITEFVKKGYMLRIDVGTYQFSADLFGKGEWADIYKIRNIQANFDFATGNVIAHIVRDEEKEMNNATDEVASQSNEEIEKLKNKGA